LLIIDYHRHDLIHPIHGKHFYSQWRGNKGGNGNTGNSGNNEQEKIYDLIIMYDGASGDRYTDSNNDYKFIDLG